MATTSGDAVVRIHGRRRRGVHQLADARRGCGLRDGAGTGDVDVEERSRVAQAERVHAGCVVHDVAACKAPLER